MEPSRVELHNWPRDCGPGGWVAPYGDPINRWVVVRVHARYVAPRVPFGAVDAAGRPMKRRPELHAYHVDLSGDQWGLPDYTNVVLHQQPPVGWWFIKEADDDYLKEIDKYRVT
jgi:hypothetical protein